MHVHVCAHQCVHMSVCVPVCVCVTVYIGVYTSVCVCVFSFLCQAQELSSEIESLPLSHSRFLLCFSVGFLDLVLLPSFGHYLGLGLS